MKKTFVLLCCLVLFFSLNAQKNMQSLVGTWQAFGKNSEAGGLEVIDSTKIYMVYGDQKIAVASYKADFTKSPAWFDFTIKDSTQEMSIKSLLLIINDDLLQWQLFDEDPRPMVFAADKGEMLYLKRKK